MAIVDLDDYVLWNIFMLNASDLNDRHLLRTESTLAASQVCQQWRTTILSSSSIWGRLLMLNNLYRDEWIEEVLRRSGESPLWVCALFRDKMEGSDTKGLLGIVEREWHRIELVELGFDEDTMLMHFLEKIATKPCPLLRSFSIFNPSDYSPFSMLFCERLFDDNIPYLTTFSLPMACAISTNMAFNLLFLRFVAHSSEDLFHVLSSAPNLEEVVILEVRKHPHDNHYLLTAPTTPISLPRLKIISGRYRLSLGAFMMLWMRLSIPLHTFEGVIEITMSDFLPIMKTMILPKLLSKVAKQLAAVQTTGTLLRISNWKSSIYVEMGHSFHLCFVIDMIPQELTNMITILLDALQIHLDSITELHFKSEYHPILSSTQYILEKLFIRLGSVRYLKITPSIMQTLLDIENVLYLAGENTGVSRLIFPLLESIHVDLASDLMFYNSASQLNDVCNALQSFLSRRQIRRIHVRDRSNTTLIQICHALDVFNGLCIEWVDQIDEETKEYICGSGGFNPGSVL